MRVRLTVLAAAVVLVQLLPGRAAADDCLPFEVGPPGCVRSVSWQTIIDRESLTIHRVPETAIFRDETGSEWSAAFTPFCAGNVNGATIIDDGLCIGALTVCRQRGADDIAGMWMVIRPLFVGPSARLEGPICFGAASRIELGPIVQDLVEDQIGADPPPILLQPADAIINLPLIASTEDRDPVEVVIQAPIYGVASATPTYAWTFEPGAGGIGPGRPYDGTSPVQNPGYYVAHTYRAIGSPTVELTVTWEVTFTIPGYPPVELDDVVRTADTTTNVRTADSELIGG